MGLGGADVDMGVFILSSGIDTRRESFFGVMSDVFFFKHLLSNERHRLIPAQKCF